MKINNINNILTLDASVHRVFGKMNGWLEAKDVISHNHMSAEFRTLQIDIYGDGETSLSVFKTFSMGSQ
jgi:hypothetical protein